MHFLQIGGLIFPKMDQMDFTGPFKVLSLVPNSEFHVLWKELAPLRDGRGLILTPDTRLDEAPPLDVLLVPGGPGQEALMEDDTVLEFLRAQARSARLVFSVCTGALICGAAGLLGGLRATTHWNSLHLLQYFGAIPVDERVVVDGKHVSAAGVSSGIDGALRVVQLLCGDRVAQAIQFSYSMRRSLYSPAARCRRRRRKSWSCAGRRCARLASGGWPRRGGWHRSWIPLERQAEAPAPPVT